MDINNHKWEPPEIQELDNMAFVIIRQEIYNLLHELHMAENYKIVNPDKEFNVYWENFCEKICYLDRCIDNSVYGREFDS